MSGSLNNAANAEPNLTPILDMVFQLITFFMLVTNFKAGAMDLKLQLPVLGSARPVEKEGSTGKQELIIINIRKDGSMNVNNQTVGDDFLKRTAEGIITEMRRDKPDAKLGDPLTADIIIRADAETNFGALYKVISTAQKNGFRRFTLKAMNRADAAAAAEKKKK